MVILLTSNLLLLMPLGSASSNGLDRRVHLSAVLFGAYFVLAIVLAGNVIREHVFAPGYNLEHILMIGFPVLFLAMYILVGVRLCRSHNLSLSSAGDR